jgi:hypothetical protein|tara:strand:- start:4727 stop:5188 length:462 start_codon:yes stop_codon:yes gene_type:complete
LYNLLKNLRIFTYPEPPGDKYSSFAGEIPPVYFKETGNMNVHKIFNPRVNTDRIIFANLKKKNNTTILHYVGYTKGPNEKYRTKYSGHGLATAIVMLHFLFSFYKHGCPTVLCPVAKYRRGKMYTLLGMVKRGGGMFTHSFSYIPSLIFQIFS